MYYFIPAWYGQTDEFWKTVIDPWYRIRQKIEFDDSLHQVRIFQDEDLAPQLLLLAYQPHLRYFLHRHDVLEVGYTAIFDLIQGITDEDMKNLQVTDLEWPEGATFVHTPFAIVVQRQHKRYAEIEFGSEGFIGMIRSIRMSKSFAKTSTMTAVLSQVVFIMKVDNQAIETILMPRESGNSVISLMAVEL